MRSLHRKRVKKFHEKSIASKCEGNMNKQCEDYGDTEKPASTAREGCSRNGSGRIGGQKKKGDHKDRPYIVIVNIIAQI